MQVPHFDTPIRISKVQAEMKALGIDALLASSSTSLLYLFGQVYSGLVYVPQEGEVKYFIRRPQSYGTQANIHYVRKIEQVSEIIATSEVRTIALELDELPYSEITRQQYIFPNAQTQNATTLLRKVRMVKTAYEIEQIKKGCQKHMEVYKKVPSVYRSGMTDTDFQIEIEHLMRQGGSVGLFRCFGSLMEFHMGSLLAGDNAGKASPYDFALGGSGNETLPLGANGSKLKRGESIMLDMAGNYGTYLSDITRTYAIGTLSEEAYRLHELSIRMHREIMLQAKPGIFCSQIYEQCLQMVKDAGAEQFFMGYEQQAQFVGHGIGLQINEMPVLTPRSKDILQEGMVIAFEPKFVLPSIGAVGIENTYLITSSGVENLSPLEEKIIYLEN